MGQALGDDLAQGLVEAWQWLRNEGFLSPSSRHWDREAVTRAGEAVPADYLALSRSTRILEDAELDHDLIATVMPSFRRGEYDVAVFAAMRLVEVSVREAARLGNDHVGTKLMERAFGPTGRLRDPLLDGGEAEARQKLFSGAIGVYKNPASHRLASVDGPQEAIEAILLANALLRTVRFVDADQSYLATAAAAVALEEAAEGSPTERRPSWATDG